MRILLAASASYDPPQGGSTRSNLVWLRAMAANGHECLVISGGDADRDTLRDGVRIRSVAQFGRNGHRVGEAVAEFDPDFVLVSSEDLSHSLLREAHRAAKDRLIYLAHTPQWFPFGPEAWNADEAAAELLHDALAIVAIGEHMAGYIERHLGRKAEIVHPALYGKAPWPEYENFGKQSVLMINPSVVKGLPIFLELARRFADKQFLALKGWGTTKADAAALRALPNVRVLETVAGIDEVFAQSAVLVAPSLWYEGFGLVVTEALLRGIPVLASAHGGLNEAAASSRYRLPVRPITSWLPQQDETGMPVGVIEAQEMGVWERALRELLGNEEVYREERTRGMEAARSFAAQVSADDLETLLHRLVTRRRRIYLIHNSTYYPGSGGGDKSNRLLVEALTSEGHLVRVFTRLERFGAAEHEAYVRELERRGIAVEAWNEIGVRFELSGAEICVVTRDTKLRQALDEDLKRFRPEVILCSTDDPAHLFFETALQQDGARVVYLVRATIALPFGPDASTLSQERTERLRLADAVVGVSEYVARYCREQGGLAAVHVPISLADHANPPDLGRFEHPYVTLVNPSAVKGLPILLGLADAMPDVKFAAVPGWGTTARDFEAMRMRPNITLLDAVEDISEILKLTRVTLVPSLWAEARSRMVVESLSRGVPVLASDVGGLREAMCGVDYVLPVNPIVRYQSSVSDQMVPEADVPEQDLRPWIDVLRELLENKSKWQDLRDRGRTAALAYLSGLNVKPLERIFRRAMALPEKKLGAERSHLSATKRRLLALRLERYRAERSRRFFPVRWGDGKRVFLFPWAAAGTQAWKFLEAATGTEFALIPALLPGREDRAGEAPAKSFGELIGPICDELLGMVEAGDPYLLAGHSMGGGLAFEVARELRRRSAAMPVGLIVSSCRSPEGRKSAARVETIADEGNAVLNADREMFGAHQYTAEEPLGIPITAIMERVELGRGWEIETSEEFRAVVVEGGHFWLLTQAELLAEEIRRLFSVKLS